MLAILGNYAAQYHKDISSYFENKIDIRPSNINLHNVIKKIGIYDINIKLHADVSCNLKINVATSLENAKSQKVEANKVEDKDEEKLLQKKLQNHLQKN